MKLEDVLLTEKDTERVWKAETKKAGRPSLTTKVWEKALAKAQCLKLLDMLDKEQLLVHSFLFPSGQHNPDCRTCELEKLLKER